MRKQSQLRLLARKRRLSRWVGYSNIGDYHAGAYECKHVSPYTKGAGNHNAAVFVLLQDWASQSWLAGPLDHEVRRIGYTPKYPTNVALRKLLRKNFRLNLKDTFATNLFPFVKPGSMSQSIPRSILVRAAEEFAWPQVRIVKPRLVVCLGLATFNAMRLATGRSAVPRIAAAIGRPFSEHGVNIWCQAHTGRLGQNNRNRGRVQRVIYDWRRMSHAFQRQA